MPEDYEDGNALAGPLREIFAVDITAATGRCVNCGLAGPIAAMRVCTRAPGLVAVDRDACFVEQYGAVLVHRWEAAGRIQISGSFVGQRETTRPRPDRSIAPVHMLQG